MSEEYKSTLTEEVANTTSVPQTQEEQQQSTEQNSINNTASTAEATTSDDIDKEVEAMKQRVKAMEDEAAKLRDMQAEVEKQLHPEEDKETVDSRSVYVGNVDYGASPEELQAHFQSCGTINRVTILCDKFTGHPKGYAYIEFAEPQFVQAACALNESLFRARLLKVTPKRTNVPGFSARGRGRGRGGFRGGFQPYYGHSPMYGYRGRGRGRGGYYAPY